MDTVDKSFVADKLNRNSCDSSKNKRNFTISYPSTPSNIQ